MDRDDDEYERLARSAATMLTLLLCLFLFFIGMAIGAKVP